MKKKIVILGVVMGFVSFGLAQGAFGDKSCIKGFSYANNTKKDCLLFCQGKFGCGGGSPVKDASGYCWCQDEQ